MRKHLNLLFLAVTLFTSCTKLDILEYEEFELMKIGVDTIVQTQVDSTRNESSTETQQESGIFVTKNSNYINYSIQARNTYHGAGAKQHLNIDGSEYFTVLSNGGDSYLYKRIDSTWNLIDINSYQKIIGGGEIRVIGTNSFLLPETGEDGQIHPSQWGGYVWIGDIQNEKLNLKKITEVKSYYLQASYGDINGDGLGDINNGSWLFMQEPNGDYKTLNISQNKQTNFGTNPQNYVDPNFNLINTTRFHQLNSQTIVNETVNLFEGGKDEIIFGFVDISDRVSESETAPRGDVLIYEYSESTKKYEVVFELPRRTIGEVEVVSHIKVADVNNDGINDILLAIVSGDSADVVNNSPPIEVWLGKSDKTFYKQSEFIKEVDITGFNLFDINDDGYLDVVLNPFGDAADWIRNWCSSDCGYRQQQGESVKDGLLLHNTIYLNDGNGSFNRIQKEIVIENTYVTWLYSFMRDGNLCFAGAVYKNLADSFNPNYDGPMDIEFIDIEFKNYF
jgi:hypothetical protein